MRRSVYSKVQVVLFAILAAAILLSVSASFAQDAAAPAAGAAKDAPGRFSLVVSLILSNIDAVFVTIMACSVIAVTLIIKSIIQVRASVMIPDASISTMREMVSNRQFKELLDFTESDPSFVSKALNPALKRAPSFSAMKEALETSIGEQTAEQFRKIEYLNIIGNLGPLLGLLGTVLGMIDSFAALQRAKGAANPAELSGGISAALTHTLLGLVLAVPCLAAFGVFRTMVDRLTIRGSLIAEELLLAIKPQEMKATAAAGVAASASKKSTGATAVAEL